MDQLKDILNQAIKYRFWIVVGISALMPMIGYFVASGAIKSEAEKKVAEINSTAESIKPFTSGEIRNNYFTDAVRAKTEKLSGTVDESWALLYERQAPLLDWPESLGEYFPAWGRKYPEDVDPNEIERAKDFYIRDYDEYAEKVYKTHNPFNYEDGTGIVVTPPKEALLVPSKFTRSKPPSLGQIWDAQEKLWLQRTVLDVIRTVNKNAADWDSAQIKQILSLSVGNAVAQDQMSLVAGQYLEKSPEPLPEGSEEAGEAEAVDDGYGFGGYGGQPGTGDYESEYGGGAMEGMMPGYGPGGGYGGMGTGDASGPIKFIVGSEEEEPPSQYRLFPIHVKLLVDQNDIPDVLAAFQNSPMTIDVREVRIQRPEQRVTKPKQGDQNPFGGMGYGMMAGGYGGEYGGGYDSDYGGGYGGMTMFGGMGGRGGMMPGMMPGGDYGGEYGGGYEGGRGGMMPGMMPGYGGMGGAVPKKSGISLREQQRQKKAEEEQKKKLEEAKAKVEPQYEIYDPYADIVMIDVYGQARIYNPPPPPEPVDTMESESEAALPAEGVEPSESMPAEGEGQPAPVDQTAPEGRPAPADQPAPEPKAESEPTPPGPDQTTPTPEPAKEPEPSPDVPQG
jgi:hypothetical protein